MEATIHLALIFEVFTLTAMLMLSALAGFLVALWVPRRASNRDDLGPNGLPHWVTTRFDLGQYAWHVSTPPRVSVPDAPPTPPARRDEHPRS